MKAVEIGNYSRQIQNIFNIIKNKEIHPISLVNTDVVSNSALTKEGYIVRGNNNIYRTTFIDLQDCEYLKIYSVINQYYGLGFYDKWKKKIKVISNANISEYGYSIGTMSRILAVPSNACYAVATLPESSYETPNSFDVSLIGKRTVNKTSIYKAPYEKELGKILCIGDSLTESYSSGDVTYPQWLARLTGLETTNKGHSGYSAKDWWDEEGNNIDFSQYDTFVIWLGTNNGLTDTLSTDVVPYDDYNDFAETDTGCYCKILSKIISQKQKAKIFLGTVYATDGNLGITNKVIEDIAALERYSSNVVGVCNNTDDELRTNGADPMIYFHPYNDNGLHFGEIGNLYLAEHWIKRIREVIYDNMALFT